MGARNPAKFDANVTRKSYNVWNCVRAMSNAEKEVLPEIVCEWHIMRLSTNNTCKPMIIVNL